MVTASALNEIDEISELIETSIIHSPPEQIYEYDREGSATHINQVTINGKSYILANHNGGNLEFLARG